MLWLTRDVRRLIGGAAALAIVAATSGAARLAPNALGSAPESPGQTTGWREAAWTLPLDNWGVGRVWLATGRDGAALRLFVRTKTGFCNCFNGIADDTEIDRIGDVDLHGGDFSPVAAGTIVSVGGTPGRERSFLARDRWHGARHVLSIVTAADCKAVVATLVSDRDISAADEASAVAFLTGDALRRWTSNQ